MGGKHPFEVIEGGVGAAAPKRKRASKPSAKRAWECRVCLVDTGIASRGLLKIKTGPQEDGQLRITGGHDDWICVACLARGRMT